MAGSAPLGLAGGTTHHSAIEQATLERGVELKPEVVFDDFDTAKIFVELGLGHAIVPAVHAYNFEKTGSVKGVLITDLPPVSIGWAFRHWHHLSPAAQAFVEIVNREIGKLRTVRGLEVLRSES